MPADVRTPASPIFGAGLIEDFLLLGPSFSDFFCFFEGGVFCMIISITGFDTRIHLAL